MTPEVLAVALLLAAGIAYLIAWLRHLSQLVLAVRVDLVGLRRDLGAPVVQAPAVADDGETLVFERAGELELAGGPVTPTMPSSGVVRRPR